MPTIMRASPIIQNTGLIAPSRLAAATSRKAYRTSLSGPNRCAGTAAGNCDSAWVTKSNVVSNPTAPSVTPNELSSCRAIGPISAKFQPIPSAITTTRAINDHEGRVDATECDKGNSGWWFDTSTRGTL